MAATSPFVRQMERLFSDQVRARGRGYAETGRIEWLDIEDDGTTAVVHGSKGNEYDVTLDWDREDGVVTVDCTCPYHNDTGPCKHLWAVILHLAEAADPRTLPSMVHEVRQLTGGGVIDLSLADGLDGDAIDTLEGAFLELAEQLGADQFRVVPSRSKKKQKGKRNKKKPHAQPPWVQDLAPVRQVRAVGNPVDEAYSATREELRLLLDVGRSQTESGLWLRLLYRERGQSGKFGKWKQKTVYPDDLMGVLSPEEDLLLKLSEWSDRSRIGFGGSYYSNRPRFTEVLLNQPESLGVLHRCCEAGIVAWSLNADEARKDAPPVAWDDGGEWDLQLYIITDEEAQEWVVSGRLIRAGTDVSLPPHEAVLAIGGLAVLHEDRLAPFPNSGHAGWVQALRRKPEIRVPFADRDRFLTTLYTAAAPPVARWPSNLEIRRLSPTPTPRMTLRSWQPRANDRRTLGEVTFDYDGYDCRAHDPQRTMRLTDPDRVLERDAAAERERLTQLFELPGVERFYEEEHGYYRYGYAQAPGSADIVFAERKLSKVLEALSSRGWEIETDGKLVRSPGALNLDITSNVDWFDLSGECNFGGVSAGLPELLKAARSGDAYVNLADGSRGLLPEGWREQLQRLADFGRAEGDAFRFSGAQTLLLDAMLAVREGQVRVDDHFRKVRRKLQKVDGVKPKKEPRTFHGTLRDYQREGLGWMKFLEQFGFGGCLADDMGLGKTVQVLALLEGRRTRKKPDDEPHRPSLAVVPKSLIHNWIGEAERFTPNLRAAAYHGTGRKQWLDETDQLDLIVTTYATLLRDIDALKEIGFDYAILDEAQAVKNPSAQASKAVRLIDARHRLAMTGTPVENHLGDLWSLFEFLNPGLLGRSQNFRKLTKILGEQPRSLETLARGVQPYVLRRTKEQVLTELPDKSEQTIHCELSRKERKLYDELREHYRKSLLGHVEQQGLAKSKIHVLEALLRLRQAACHPGLVNTKFLKQSSTKLDILEEQLEELLSEGHKALVFSQFTSLLSILKARLDRKKVVYEYLDGKTTKRQQCVDRFQTDDDCRLFLISVKAGGQGLNLTAADYVFILDPWWNPAVEAQAVDRAHRIGQSRHVFAYRLIATDTVEEKILQLQAYKRELADSIITENAGLLQNLSLDDLKLLLS